MAYIPLGKSGLEAEVDDDLYHVLTEWRWCPKRSSDRHGSKPYARRRTRVNGRSVTLLLSHVVLALDGRPRPGPEWTADHKDGNTLRDVASNLRWLLNPDQQRNKDCHRRGERHPNQYSNRERAYA